MRAWIACGVACLITAGSAAGQAGDAPRSVRLGVFAECGEAEARARWQPTAEVLAEALPGLAFRIEPLAADALWTAVERGALDLVIADAAVGVELEHRHGGIRLAALARPGPGLATDVCRDAAVVFARSDRDDLLAIGALRGRAFVAVSESAFDGWRMAWRELVRAGVDPRTGLASLRFAGSPEAVVAAVQDRTADAGTVPAGVLERLAADGRIVPEDFRVLDDRAGDDPAAWRRSTPLYPGWTMAALRDTPGPLARRVAAALLLMPAGSPAAQAAGCAGWTVPPDDAEVHACLQAIGIGHAPAGERPATDGSAPLWVGGALLVAVLASAGVAGRRVLCRVAGDRRDLSRERLARQSAESERDRRSRQLEALAELGRLAEEDAPWTEVLERAASRAAEAAGARLGGVFRSLPGAGSLLLQAGVGWLEGRVGKAMVEASHSSLPGAAHLSRRPVRVDDTQTEDRCGTGALLAEHGTLSGVSVPIPGYGVLGVYADRRKAFGPDVEPWLGSVALVLSCLHLRSEAGAGSPAPAAGRHGDTDRRDRLADLVPRYLANRKEDVKALRDALERNDFETVGRLGRDMMGTGGGYGFPAIAGIGGDLARAADDRDAPAARRAVDALESGLARGGTT